MMVPWHTSLSGSSHMTSSCVEVSALIRMFFGLPSGRSPSVMNCKKIKHWERRPAPPALTALSGTQTEKLFSPYFKTLLVDNKVSSFNGRWFLNFLPKPQFLINIRRETPTVWKRQSSNWNNAVAANPGLNGILSCCSLMNCHSLHENPLHKLSCSSLINIH